MSNVVVVGSANLDLMFTVQQIPKPGETVLASRSIRHVGGKGANQAVAAARLGATTSFVGCVGDDDNGRSVLRSLQDSGVDVTDVELMGGVDTGLAVVTVSDQGENSIIVLPGANELLPADRVERVLRRRTGEDLVVVLQAEIPVDTIIRAIRTAHDLGAVVVLNIAPFVVLPPDVLGLVDVIIVNEVEAAELLGDPGVVGEDPIEAALAVAAIGRCGAVITLGSKGAVWADRKLGTGRVQADDVTVVDTTGAGDAFVGAVASALSAGRHLDSATELGAEVGSFAVQRRGAQRSYPRAADLASASAS